MAWSVDFLPSNPAALIRFPAEVRKFNFYPGTGCVCVFCVLSCVVSGGNPDIVLTKHSEKPTLVYLVSVMVHRPLLPL